MTTAVLHRLAEAATRASYHDLFFLFAVVTLGSLLPALRLRGGTRRVARACGAAKPTTRAQRTGACGPPPLHEDHRRNPPGVGDVVERVGVEHDEVGALAGVHRPRVLSPGIPPSSASLPRCTWAGVMPDATMSAISTCGPHGVLPSVPSAMRTPAA